jgi:magnesium-transporting ATPase (P-type)
VVADLDGEALVLDSIHQQPVQLELQTVRHSSMNRCGFTRKQPKRFVHLFTNAWLWAAIGGSIALQVLVVYVPFLQPAFGMTGFSGGDWVFCSAVAQLVLWLRASKFMRS